MKNKEFAEGVAIIARCMPDSYTDSDKERLKALGWIEDNESWHCDLYYN